MTRARLRSPAYFPLLAQARSLFENVERLRVGVRDFEASMTSTDDEVMQFRHARLPRIRVRWLWEELRRVPGGSKKRHRVVLPTENPLDIEDNDRLLPLRRWYRFGKREDPVSAAITRQLTNREQFDAVYQVLTTLSHEGVARIHKVGSIGDVVEPLRFAPSDLLAGEVGDIDD